MLTVTLMSYYADPGPAIVEELEEGCHGKCSWLEGGNVRGASLASLHAWLIAAISAKGAKVKKVELKNACIGL